MKYLRWLPLLLVLIAAWNLNLRPRVINLDEEQDIADPAVTLATREHSEDWGGLDRWAYPGLEYWRVLRRLQQAGFACRAPQDPARGGEPQSGQYTVHCQRAKAWPLQRELTLELRVSYDLPGGGRLLAATAASTVKAAAWREQLAALLRRLHLLEPATLTITGLQAATTEELARIVADALKPDGRDMLCAGNTRMSCNSLLAERGRNGFPALPEGPWPVGNLAELRARLANVGFAGMGRVPDRDRFLPLRVADGQLWLDLQRQDLGGERETLSIALHPVGAQPQLLALQGRSGRREFPLDGRATTYSDGQPQWLFPLMAGAFVHEDDAIAESGGRKGLWLYPPAMDEDGDRLQRFAANLAFVDAGFQPRLLQAYLDALRHEDSAEAALGLQPPLQTADRMAAALQRSGIGALLPAAEADALVAEKYPGDEGRPVRAAWALYRCEHSRGGGEIDPACWAGFMQTDRAASLWLQQDLQTQLQAYAGLDAGNPVQRRLQRLAMAYTTGASRP